MNPRASYSRAKAVPAEIPKPGPLHVRLGVNNCDVQKEVKRAFDLARSAGRELNVTFAFRVS